MCPSLLVSRSVISFYRHELELNLNSYVGFSLCNLNLDLSESTEELLCVDFLISIETVEVSEDSSQASDGLCSSCIDLGSHLLEN